MILRIIVTGILLSYTLLFPEIAAALPVTTTVTPNYAIILNETIIPLDDYDHALDEALNSLQRIQYIDLNSPEGQAMVAITRKSLIQDMVNQYILENGSQQLGVTVATTNIHEQLRQLKT